MTKLPKVRCAVGCDTRWFVIYMYRIFMGTFELLIKHHLTTFHKIWHIMVNNEPVISSAMGIKDEIAFPPSWC